MNERLDQFRDLIRKLHDSMSVPQRERFTKLMAAVQSVLELEPEHPVRLGVISALCVIMANNPKTDEIRV